MVMYKETQFRVPILIVVTVLMLMLEACIGGGEFVINEFGPFDLEASQLEANGELPLGFTPINPDNLAVTYEWTSTGGTFKVASNTETNAVYVAPAEPGTQIITVRAMQGDNEIAKETMTIEIVAAAGEVIADNIDDNTDNEVVESAQEPTEEPYQEPTEEPTQAPTKDPTSETVSTIASPSTIELDPNLFVIQGTEFFLDIHKPEAVEPLPLENGVDLSNYDLEFTFQGGDDKQVQLYYKDQEFKNVWSQSFTIQSGQPTRYNPFADGRSVDEFDDFTHIYGVGANVIEGVEGITIESAKLISRQSATSSPTSEATPAAATSSTPSEECGLVSLRPPLDGPSVEVEVEITTPSHCAMGLDPSISAGGTYTGDLTDKKLWILIYPIDARQYFPQTLNPCQESHVDVSGGAWEAILNFGGPPQKYDVVAMVTEASSEISGEFERWFQEGCETGHFPGYSRQDLERFTGVTEEVGAITVSTMKDSAEEAAQITTEEPPTSDAASTANGNCPFGDIPLRVPIEGSPIDLEVEITSIGNCTDNLPGASPIPLSGTLSRELNDNEELWILVYALDNNYYPQSQDVCLNQAAATSGGQWEETIRLGRPNVPEGFYIVAVVTEAGSPASNDFHKYLTDGCAGNWGFVPFISEGATELDSIIVHTK